MNKRHFFSLLILALTVPLKGQTYSLLVEAESFENKGGWLIDQQSMDVMGSPYLIAHGMGQPVTEASTHVIFPEGGTYHLYVRTRNWTEWWSEQAAGTFQIKINGTTLPHTFGTTNVHWHWESGGTIELDAGVATIGLEDLTGFDGRIDALYFTQNAGDIPPNQIAELDAFRMEKLARKPSVDTLDFDFVVVGGGMAGTCAAISAARQGIKVALIQNRPVLGGNNSSEVRVHLGARINLEPYPALGNLVNEIGPGRGGNAQPQGYYEDDKKLKAVLNEPNISLFLNHHANQVIVDGKRIKQVVAEQLETGNQVIFNAPLFADCTGDGTIGFLAGAEYMVGRESKATFNERTAPEVADNLTMGISVQWFAETSSEPQIFPDIDWGLPMDDQSSYTITRGDWDWETGMGKDMIQEAEYIRDYGLLVVYSNWSYLKNHHSQRVEFANERLKWVAYIGGKRESRRLVGDYILTENDLTGQNYQSDGTASTSWTIDLHYPDSLNEKEFNGQAFRSIAKHIAIYPYPIPFRCLYSKNVDNLMMAGRDISVSHVALGSVRLMRTCGMMGEVIGMAAGICRDKGTTPRGLYQNYFSELELKMMEGVGNPELPMIQTYNLGGTLMETKD